MQHCSIHSINSINTCLAFGQATQNHLQAFGLTWDETSGKNNG
jgi:hypothetical protein